MKWLIHMLGGFTADEYYGNRKLFKDFVERAAQANPVLVVDVLGQGLHIQGDVIVAPGAALVGCYIEGRTIQ